MKLSYRLGLMEGRIVSSLLILNDSVTEQEDPGSTLLLTPTLSCARRTGCSMCTATSRR